MKWNQKSEKSFKYLAARYYQDFVKIENSGFSETTIIGDSDRDPDCWHHW